MDIVIMDVGSNGVKGFVANWTRLSPGEDPNLKKKTENMLQSVSLLAGTFDPEFYGAASEVADTIEHWVNVSGVYRFNFTYAVTSGTFEKIFDDLIFVLHKRV